MNTAYTTQPEDSTLLDFLENSQWIDWRDAAVLDTAMSISRKAQGVHELIKNCFEFVRDEIKHSWDHQCGPVTVRASDVLAHGTGFCFAKSHLLAALLRANTIPAALCYQRLGLAEGGFSLHGLNAVWLHSEWLKEGDNQLADASTAQPKERPFGQSQLTQSEFVAEEGGWYRLDARGNTDHHDEGGSVNAQFSPPSECLAFSAKLLGEIDSFTLNVKPLPLVLDRLQAAEDIHEFSANLPDAKIT